jgi:hypothetical protein
LLAERSILPLAIGASSAGSTSATIPAGTTVGTWYVIALADALNQVAEISEINNRRVFAIKVP